MRAVQRYERELGFPVRRIRTASGQTVYAFREEIDKWRASLDAGSPTSEQNGSSSGNDESAPHQSEAAPPRNHLRAVAWVGFALASLAGIGTAARGYWLSGSTGETIATLQWEGNHLEAIDSRGRTLWSQDFDSASARASEALDGLRLADLDGDSIPEVIAAVRFSEPGTQPVSDAVYVLSHGG